MLICDAFPGKPVLTSQHNGQCVHCTSRVWRVLLGEAAYSKRRFWVSCEAGDWTILHVCPNHTPEAA
jgi:hypothetical protein